MRSVTSRQTDSVGSCLEWSGFGKIIGYPQKTKKGVSTFKGNAFTPTTFINYQGPDLESLGSVPGHSSGGPNSGHFFPVAIFNFPSGNYPGRHPGVGPFFPWQGRLGHREPFTSWGNGNFGPGVSRLRRTSSKRPLFWGPFKGGAHSLWRRLPLLTGRSPWGKGLPWLA